MKRSRRRNQRSWESWAGSRLYSGQIVEWDAMSTRTNDSAPDKYEFGPPPFPEVAIGTISTYLTLKTTLRANYV